MDLTKQIKLNGNSNMMVFQFSVQGQRNKPKFHVIGYRNTLKLEVPIKWKIKVLKNKLF